MTYKRLIGVAGSIAWIMVGLPAFIYHVAAPTIDWRWVVAYLVFGAAFAADLRRPRIALLVPESAAAITLVLLRCNGYEGALLVVLAMQLGGRLGRWPAFAWITAQTVLLAAAVTLRLKFRSAVLLVPPYFGFQLLAYYVFYVMTREMAARSELLAANAELQAVQHILADSSRMAERLRIAHELHDALGHSLTALTLNLEAALQTNHPAKDRIELAQTLARRLLNDVRAIVSEARETVPISDALQALINRLPRPCIHLSVEKGLTSSDPEGAHALIRCVQEIITNAARHSGAENLWIVVENHENRVRVRAHDDGAGRQSEMDGFGLRGMRERVERAGGAIEFSSQPGQGFGITATIPMRGGAA
jgi:signal transduction histidine kinase